MQFNPHFDLSGKHAFLSASKYSWIRYDDEKLVETYANHQNSMLGTRLHALASELISLGVKLPKTQKTLNLFVNDVIGFRMQSEQVLYFSANVFGTADGIGFRKPPKSDRYKLMIFDLKNGETKASFDQLMIYAAMFCHEYGWKPTEIDIELRIYQYDDVQILIPEVENIILIMEKMAHFDEIIERMKSEALA